MLRPLLLSLLIGTGASAFAQQPKTKTGAKPATKKAAAKPASKATVAAPAPVVPAPAPKLDVTYSTSLQKIEKDQLVIKVEPATITTDKAVYRLPAMVPGTYKVYNFGRWISGFEAVGKKPNTKLAVAKLDSNSWQIDNAKELAYITYRVSDSFDSLVKNIPFEPAGSNIEDSASVLMNTFCYFGYFDGQKNLPLTLKVSKPAGVFGATSMLNTSPTTPLSQEDVFKARDYVELADNPILYTWKADTASVMVGSTKVLISVYDAAKKTGAKDLMPSLQSMLKAASDYFGGKLPAERYSFLIHYQSKPFLSQSAGALEHNTSSVYTLPSEEPENAAKSLQDIASHEFFHIITPLNIHSEEIGDFDFANPRMSRHLWLYEGQTEYMSSYVLFRQGVKTTQEYLAGLRRYIGVSKRYFNDTLPFTDMSLKVLGETESQYSNVYLKGPLINLCLDLTLRKNSGGVYGLKELVADLSKKYGQTRSFKDPELFDEIASLSGQPQIRSFFTRYVEGKEPLPLAECLGYVGVDYSPKVETRKLSMGKVSLQPVDGKVVVADNSEMNEFGKAIGYEVGDVLVSVDGVALEFTTMNATMEAWRAKTQEGQKVTIVLERNGKKIKKTAKAVGATSTETHVLKLAANPTTEQLKLWKSWAGEIPTR